MTRILQAALVLAIAIGVLRPVHAAAQPGMITGDVAETARAMVFKWDKAPNATWYYLWVHDANGLTYQQWYTDTEANCHPGYLEDCRVGVPLSVVPSGNVTWWVRPWGPDGYGPWTAGQVVGPPGPYFAVVGGDGVTARGNNVSSSRISTGVYVVIFGRNISGCGFNGSLGGINNENSTGIISVTRRVGNVNGVWVVIRDLAGALVDQPFHVTIVCP